MSDWSKRLQRVQAEMPSQEVESIDHLTLETLQSEKVRFGKAHQGKTYAEVWDSAPDWIKWFLGHYQESKDLEHRKMIKFIKLKIEAEETEGEQPVPSTSTSQGKGRSQDLDGGVQESSCSTSRCLSRGANKCRDEQPPSSNDPSRACAASDLSALDAQRASRSGAIDHGGRPPGAPSGIGMGGSLDSMRSHEEDCNWALTAGEIDVFHESQSNQERRYFQNLVSMMEKELKMCEETPRLLDHQLTCWKYSAVPKVP